MRKKRMDRKVGKNTRVYHEMMTGTATAFLTLVDLYCILFNNTVEEFFWGKIESIMVRKILQFVLYFLVFNLLYRIVLRGVCTYMEQRWIRHHKDLWIRGKWLHIHEKADGSIRIGVVTIQQNFYEIKVDAKNMSYPEEKGSVNTNWEYHSAKLSEERGSYNVIGCYEAIKDGIDQGNQGIHALKIRNRDGKGYPRELSGKFSDTFRKEKTGGKSVDLGDHCGKLTLFWMTEKVENIVYPAGSLCEEELIKLDQNSRCADEPFVQTLKKLSRRT